MEQGLDNHGQKDNLETFMTLCKNGQMIYFPPGNYLFSAPFAKEYGDLMFGTDVYITTLLNEEEFAKFSSQLPFTEK